MNISDAECHICGFRRLHVVECNLRSVTSDCKPWNLEGKIAVCSNCGTVQSVVTPEWIEDCKEIYRNYQVYHQACGAEQAVFTSAGSANSRSRRLISNLSQSLPLSQPGHLLDIGCGNGGFLKSFGATFPGWSFSGCEYDEKNINDLLEIPGFKRLHTGDLSEIDSTFSLIAMVHTLEHIINPVSFLKSAKRLLAPGGCLFIQLPNYQENPFELMTADHASHFSRDTLATALHQSGFTPDLISTNWVAKELSCVAKVTNQESYTQVSNPSSEERILKKNVKWLTSLIQRAATLQGATSTPFGIFGSSIAATVTATNLPILPDFFVDEDPSRKNMTHLGRPIYDPEGMPTESTAFIALQPREAEQVYQRLETQYTSRWRR